MGEGKNVCGFALGKMISSLIFASPAVVAACLTLRHILCIQAAFFPAFFYYTRRDEYGVA